MKYVISDKGEVNIGTTYHSYLADGMEGKIVAAGHCNINPNGTIMVYGESLGFRIKAKPQDIEILEKYHAANIRTNQAIH